MSIRGKCNACCVPGCNSNSTPSFRNRGGRITTFKIPRDENRRKEWIQAIPKRKYPPTVNHNVCILHFNEEDFSRNNRRIDLKKSAVPSIFPFVDGQENEENSDVCDEVWIEYTTYKKESTNLPSENVNNELPSPISDLTRILIERLRIPGSKYFGIDTAEITIEPESDVESDISEQNRTTSDRATATIKIKRTTKKPRLDISEPEMNVSSDELNDNFDEFNPTDDNTWFNENAEKSDVVIKLNSNDTGTSKVDGDEEKFGAMVSSKLLLMSPLQRLMSEKIISEILLKGQLGMLQSSLSPVLVSGYMKHIPNGGSHTNLVSTERSSPHEDINDPLMFQIKQEDCDTNFETLDMVKDEVSWSDDSQT